MMRHMVRALVAAGLLVASAPVAPVAGAAEGRRHYVVVPDNVYWGSSVRFTNGRPTRVTRSMTVQVKVTHPQEIDPVSYRDVVIEEAATGDGRNLVPPPAGGRAHWRTQERPIHKWGGHMARRNSFNLVVGLAGVGKPPKAIKRLKGSFTLSYSEGFTEVAIDSPGRLEKGKRIEHDDLGDHQVFFLGANEREVRFRFSYAANKILKEVKFYEAGGQEVRSWGSGTSGDGRWMERSYRVKLPEDGKVVLRFHGEVKSEKVTFELNDVPLEVPEVPEGQGGQGGQRAPQLPEQPGVQEVF